MSPAEDKWKPGVGQAERPWSAQCRASRAAKRDSISAADVMVLGEIRRALRPWVRNGRRTIPRTEHVPVPEGLPGHGRTRPVSDGIELGPEGLFEALERRDGRPGKSQRR